MCDAKDFYVLCLITSHVIILLVSLSKKPENSFMFLLFLETAVLWSTETFSGVHVYDCACFVHTFAHLLLKVSLAALQLFIFSAW
jgi:hypothetical protein